MDWVTEYLAIGSYRTTRDFERLKQQGVEAVLYLFEDRDDWPEECKVLHLPIVDGEPVRCETIKRGTEFVRSQIASRHKVVIACGAGISRSATLVLACLLEDNYSLLEAWRLLKLKHPIALPHPAMWKSLIDCYQLPDLLSDCLRWK